MKIHEIAKKLNLNSKEVLEKAKKLGIEVKSHLSSVSDEEATKILDSYKQTDNNVVKNNQNMKSEVKKEENKKGKDVRSCNY